jgi:hypothetical protein
MTKQAIIILFFTCLTYLSNGQPPSYIAVSTADQIPWKEYTPSNKRFIVAGEAHHVSIIYPFQLSHLKYLVTKGFRHLIWEVPFSYSIIAQHYISTGNDSLFKLIGGYKEVEAYWKEVYKLNQTLPEDDKLHLWGIDHELGDDMFATHHAKLFKKALTLLADGKGSLPALLQQEYLSLQNAVSIKDLTNIKNRLKQVQHHHEVALFFGNRLPYFQILVNRLDHYKVGRNDEMLDAFKEICSLFHLDNSAKFLGRFGWGHTDKSYKKSISWMLENDTSSPVKASTYVVGVQYINCTVFRHDNNRFIKNNGVLKNRTQKRELAALHQQDPTPIKIFNWPSGEKRKGWAKAADVLFVFSGFPGITPL